MEAVVEREINGRSPSKIRNLSIDQCKSSEITGLSKEFTNLETLSIADAGLKSLAGLPKLPKLNELILTNNQLDGGDLAKLVENCPKLERLILKGNPITDLSQLKPLEKLSTLKQVDLEGTDVANGSEFQKKLREMLPQLSDEKSPTNDDGDSDDDDGEDDSDDDGPGLGELMKGVEDEDDDDDDDEFNAEDDDDDEDFEVTDEDDEDDGGEPEEKTSPIPAGKKRKIHEVEKEE